MRRILVGVLMAVFLVSASGCAGLVSRATSVTGDVVMAGPNVVVAEGQALVDFGKNAVKDNPLVTAWNAALLPLKVTKAGVESLLNSLGSLFGHLTEK